MISVQNLTKKYGRTTAVDNISFEVREREIVGFLGPNGAGKTTTMQILAGYLPATGGTVRVAGFDVISDSLEVRRRIGYLPETAPLYRDMRVQEYLRFRGRLKGLHGRRLKDRVDDVVFDCGLLSVRKRIIGQLSKGFQQRVGLADSLVHSPELLILDEPTIGLDPNQIRHIRNLIKSLAERHTVILSSHILQEVEMICQKVLIIDRGKIVASDTTDRLIGLMKGNPHAIVEVRGPETDVLAQIGKIEGIMRVTHQSDGDWLRLSCECMKDVEVRERIYDRIKANGWGLRELSMERRKLEDVFVEMTTQQVKR